MPSCILLATAGANGQVPNTGKTDIPEIVRKEYIKAYGEVPEIQIRQGSRPNILLITSDQQIWESISCNDGSIETPNIDRLVSAGTVYDRAYTCNPVSTPTRASMITGMYPSQHGAIALGTKLPETVPTVGEYLGQIGYSTYLIGKAHFMPLAGTAEFPSLEAYPILQDLDFWKKFNGPFYGFSHVDLARNHGDEGHVGQHYALWMMEKLKKEGRDPNEWRSWFAKPSHSYAEYNPEMDDVTARYTATNPKSQYGAWNCPEEYHLNAWIAETTNKRIGEAVKKEKPFFVWASFFDPHPPYLVPEPWDKMYDPEDMQLPYVPEGDMDDMPYHYRMTQTRDNSWAREYDEDGFSVHGFHSHMNTDEAKARKNKALYYGMISMMDKYIGKILDYLDANGLTENTLIIFTTDHGNHIGSHGLHAKGGFVFEEDIKIPFIVSWKGHYPEARRTDALLSIVDLAPTLLSVAGMERLPYTMTGLNAEALFKGETDAIRDNVIVENHFQRTRFYQKAFITSEYKIVWYMNSDEGELFDLKNDPHEYNNLWDNPEYTEIKYKLLHKAMQADMKKEICFMPRIGPA